MCEAGVTLSLPMVRNSNPWGIAMLLKTGVFEMFVSKRQVKDMVLYSPQHIARMEAAGAFPKRVKLGNNRVGWVKSEVEDWIQERIDARDNNQTP